MESTQVIDNLMSDMLDKIEKQNSGDDYIQQELNKLHKLLLFLEVVNFNLTAPKKNEMDSSPKMYNLIADI